TSSATVVLATSAETFESALASAKPGGLCLLHFRADWAAQCVQMSLVMDELAKEPAYSAVTFVNVEAEQLYAAGELLGGLDVVREMDEAGELGPALKAAVTARLEKLVKAAPVMLFMKGSPDAPAAASAGRSWSCCAPRASSSATSTSCRTIPCERA
ncbi:hypothetical protein BOX15_Mlig029058g3, partial [Macrostomum lignano]